MRTPTHARAHAHTPITNGRQDDKQSQMTTVVITSNSVDKTHSRDPPCSANRHHQKQVNYMQATCHRDTRFTTHVQLTCTVCTLYLPTALLDIADFYMHCISLKQCTCTMLQSLQNHTINRHSFSRKRFS